MKRKKLLILVFLLVVGVVFLLCLTICVLDYNSSDSTLQRRLPPMPTKADTAPIKERNLLLVKINADGNLYINNQLADISELKERVKIFLTSDGLTEELPEIEEKQIAGLGLQKLSKGVISLNTDRGTKYQTYLAVQKEILNAYNEIRDEYAMSQFGAVLDELTEDKAEAVRAKIPIKISEIEDTTKKVE